MSRVNISVASRNKRKRTLARAKGFLGRRGSCYKLALRSTQKAMRYEYVDRKKHKRVKRSEFIMRINAFARENNLTYSAFMFILSKNNIDINRKQLCILIQENPVEFKKMLSSSNII